MKPITIKINSKSFDAFLLDNFIEWNIGLMFSPKKILVFDFKNKTDALIHMIFVFYPIYAIALDKKRKVINAKILYPFISFFKFSGDYLVEIPRGFIKLDEQIKKKEWNKIILKW